MLPEKPPFALQTVIIVAVGGWVVWGLFTLFVAFGFGGPNAMAIAGQIGDLFGGVNALFSALAFVMVWWSGDMQRRELSLQRKELSLQLEELKAQRDELIETRSVFRRQNFEAAFFQQLNLFRNMAETIKVGDNVGATAIGSIRGRCVRILAANDANPDLILTVEGYVEFIAQAYMDSVYRYFEAGVGSYFRTLYHIYKLIDVQDMPYADKVMYANLVRAQLSSDDVIVLAVNGKCSVGAGFVPLIERYGVLKHLPNGGPLARIRTCYSSNAFLGFDERDVSEG